MAGYQVFIQGEEVIEATRGAEAGLLEVVHRGLKKSCSCM